MLLIGIVSGNLDTKCELDMTLNKGVIDVFTLIAMGTVTLATMYVADAYYLKEPLY